MALDNFTPYTRGGSWPPEPPQGRMPLEQRAKIFTPFEPLRGLRIALREKEEALESAHPDMNPLAAASMEDEPIFEEEPSE